MRRLAVVCGLVVAVSSVPAAAQAPETVPYDHVHLSAADLNGKSVAFTAGPQPKPNANGHRTGYVEGPGGARIELVEHTECRWK